MSTTHFLKTFLKVPKLPPNTDPEAQSKIIAEKVRHWFLIYRNPESVCGSSPPNKFELSYHRRNARQNLRRLSTKYPKISEQVLRDVTAEVSQ